jgi:uncharacterized protein (TIGR03663 family)
VKKTNNSLLFFILIIIGGAVLRLTSLPQKPMHNDEAVNAVKFGNLLEKGEYAYDKIEYHGPVLYYITLIPAWVSSVQYFSQLNERHLRVVPAIAGIGLLLLLIILVEFAGWKVVLASSLIGAISPAMVFYSRYYIHETLLVFFTFGFIISLFAFLVYRKNHWLIVSAIFLGLMHTTKETFLISLVIFFVSLYLDQKIWQGTNISVSQVIKSMHWYQYLVFLGIAGFISVLFFSSFFKNPQGIIDSVSAYENYFTKAGQNSVHQHPWYYYLSILAWNKGPGSLIWTELPVLIFSFLGIFFVFYNKGNTVRGQFFRIMALFSILMMLIFSIMPYKTPWNILSSYFGLILLAGFGCIEVLNSFNKGMMRKTILIIMIAAALSLITQVIYTIYKYPSHPSNPYVYGHTSSDVFHMIDRINKVSEMNPEGKGLLVQVICSNDDYWPLPWYLREYNQVGWWNKIDSNTPLSPLMVVSPDLKELLVKKMYVEPKPGEKYLYVPLFDEGTELRPGVLLDGYVRKDYFTDQGSNE